MKALPAMRLASFQFLLAGAVTWTRASPNRLTRRLANVINAPLNPNADDGKTSNGNADSVFLATQGDDIVYDAPGYGGGYLKYLLDGDDVFHSNTGKEKWILLGRGDDVFHGQQVQNTDTNAHIYFGDGDDKGYFVGQAYGAYLGRGNDIFIGGDGEDTYVHGDKGQVDYANNAGFNVYGVPGATAPYYNPLVQAGRFARTSPHSPKIANWELGYYSGDDYINTGGGNDYQITGGGGNDIIYAGPGVDFGIMGGTGDDVIDGGPGSDYLLGEDGNDWIIYDFNSNGVKDTIVGGNGCDYLVGPDGIPKIDPYDVGTPACDNMDCLWGWWSDCVNGTQTRVKLRQAVGTGTCTGSDTRNCINRYTEDKTAASADSSAGGSNPGRGVCDWGFKTVGNGCVATTVCDDMESDDTTHCCGIQNCREGGSPVKLDIVSGLQRVDYTSYKSDDEIDTLRWGEWRTRTDEGHEVHMTIVESKRPQAPFSCKTERSRNVGACGAVDATDYSSCTAKDDGGGHNGSPAKPCTWTKMKFVSDKDHSTSATPENVNIRVVTNDDGELESQCQVVYKLSSGGVLNASFHTCAVCMFEEGECEARRRLLEKAFSRRALAERRNAPEMKWQPPREQIVW